MGEQVNKNVEEQKLEELFKKACEIEAERPVFLKTLLDSYIYILGSSSVQNDGEETHTLTESSQVQIKSWNRENGSQVLPFFTSLEKLQHAIQHHENYLKMKTQSFLS